MQLPRKTAGPLGGRNRPGQDTERKHVSLHPHLDEYAGWVHP